MEKYVGKDYKPKKLNIENILTKALNNDNNENIMKLDKSKISKLKNDILQKLQLNKKELKELHKKLKDYRYVVDLADMNYGSYIRWINLNKEEIKLTNGAIMIDIKMTSDGLRIMCKNNMNKIFLIDYDVCLIFQKINQQESVLLEVIEYISKT
jgi:hypothetical protein